MKDLSSYVPESLHTVQKRQSPCRLFFEDCAVIEPEKSFRILASRGGNLPLGEDFLKVCGVLPSDTTLLQSTRAKQSRFLLPCKKGCVLLLGDRLLETALFLGILIQRDAKEVLCALERLGQNTFATPQGMLSEGHPLQSRYDEALCLQMEELFYYLERILHPAPEASLWTRCLLIANFAGCRLERVALPITEPSLSETDHARITLFLLCSFLTLRQKSGRIWTEGEKDDPNYRCTVSFFEESLPFLEAEEPDQSEQDEKSEAPFFLQAPCFSSLTAIPTDSGMKLETKFPLLQKNPPLGAFNTSTRLCLHFLLAQACRKSLV